MDAKNQLPTVEDYIAHGGSAWPLVWDSLVARYAKRGIKLDWDDVERRIRERRQSQAWNPVRTDMCDLPYPAMLSSLGG